MAASCTFKSFKSLRQSFVLICMLFVLSGCNDPSEIPFNDTTNDAVVLDFKGARTLSAGFRHTCAIVEYGKVKCWGDNESAQLGQNDTNDRADAPDMGAALQAVDLGTGSIAVEVASGESHSCALLDTGRIKCWSGNNLSGQVGEPTTSYPLNIVTVNLGTNGLATQIVVGGTHSCALLVSGQVKCWGDNGDGQLGLGDTNVRGDDIGEMGNNLPVVNLGSNHFATQLTAASNQTCVLLDDGSVKCWGSNVNGGLGLGDIQSRGDDPGEMGDALPVVDLGSGRTAKRITSGGGHTCAILDNDQVKCWGRNWNGLLGIGDVSNRGDDPGEMGDALPIVDLGADVIPIDIAANWVHTCVLLDNGKVKCWGKNNESQLGSGDTLNRGANPGEMGDALAVVELGDAYYATEITTGFNFTCARLATSEIKCWGNNTKSQLGRGDGSIGNRAGEMGDELLPIDIGSGRTVTQVAVGSFRTCALLDTQEVKCWGQNTINDKGIGVGLGDQLPAANLGSGRTATQITASSYHTCALLDNGQVKCWDRYLQVFPDTNIVDGITIIPWTPYPYLFNAPNIDLGTGRTAIQIASGTSHDCALLDNYQIKCWGSNFAGQLGLEDMNFRGDEVDELGDFLPYVNLGSGRTAVQIAAGDNSTCAVLDNGQVKCWGSSWFGELGSGATAIGDNPGEMGDALLPLDLGVGRTALHVVTSMSQTCVVLDNGSVKCWGFSGQSREMNLGVGRTVQQLATSYSHSCALLDNFQVKCWGDNQDAQLGLENSNSRGALDDLMGDTLPVIDLGSGRTAVQVAVDGMKSCAVLDNGQLKCWGGRWEGALGQKTDYIGDTPSEMGNALPSVDL